MTTKYGTYQTFEPFNHLTLSTGHNYLVPVDKVRREEMEQLRGLVLAGGGPIPRANGSYKFFITSDDPDSCVFSVWKGDIPLLTCNFQNPSSNAGKMWDALIQGNKILPEPVRLHRIPPKPSEPWLAVSLLPTIMLATTDLHWLTDFEQSVAETWRHLPATDRENISSPGLIAMLNNQSNEGATRPHHNNKVDSGRPPCDELNERQQRIETLTRWNNELAIRVKLLKSRTTTLNSS